MGFKPHLSESTVLTLGRDINLVDLHIFGAQFGIFEEGCWLINLAILAAVNTWVLQTEFKTATGEEETELDLKAFILLMIDRLLNYQSINSSFFSLKFGLAWRKKKSVARNRYAG